MDGSFPFNISSGNENLKEILGFLHHQISQQSKDIALLNRRVAELSNSKSEQESPVAGESLNVYIEASNKHFDGLAASIRAVTDQLLQHEKLVNEKINTVSSTIRSEFTEKLDRLNNRIDDVQHIADNSRCNEDIIELKLSEITAKEREREDVMNKFEKEISMLREGSQSVIICPSESSGKPRAQSRMSIKRGLMSRPATTTSSRRKRVIPEKETPLNVEHMKIVDLKPKNITDITQELKQAKSTLLEMKNAENSIIEIRDKLEFTIVQNSKEFTSIYERMDEFALKSDLNNIIQGFIASGADGVADFAARNRLRRPSDPHPSLSYAHTDSLSSGKLGNQTRAAHVKLITGECLKRPVTTPGRTRLRSYGE